MILFIRHKILILVGFLCKYWHEQIKLHISQNPTSNFVHPYKSPYSLQVYRFTCAHIILNEKGLLEQFWGKNRPKPDVCGKKVCLWTASCKPDWSISSDYLQAIKCLVNILSKHIKLDISRKSRFQPWTRWCAGA